MADTATSVANEALLLLGQGFIAELDEKSQKAEIARLFFDPCVRTALRDANWNAATARKVLPRISTDPDFGWSYAYRLPSNYIRIVAIYDGDGDKLETDQYDLEGRAILTNCGEIRLRYVEETSISLMPRDFVDCVAALLAAKMASKLTGSNSKVQNMYALYQDRLNAAIGSDAVADEQDTARDVSVLEAIR